MILKPTKSLFREQHLLLLIILLVSYQTNLASNQVIDEIRGSKQEHESEELGEKISTTAVARRINSLEEGKEAKSREEEGYADKPRENFDKDKLDLVGGEGLSESETETESMFDNSNYNNNRLIGGRQSKQEDEDEEDGEGELESEKAKGEDEDGNEIEVEIGNEFFIYLPRAYGDPEPPPELAGSHFSTQQPGATMTTMTSQNMAPHGTSESIGKPSMTGGGSGIKVALSNSSKISSTQTGIEKQQLRRNMMLMAKQLHQDRQKSDEQIDDRSTLKGHQVKMNLLSFLSNKQQPTLNKSSKDWPLLDRPYTTIISGQSNNNSSNNNESSNYNEMFREKDKNSSLLKIDPSFNSLLDKPDAMAARWPRLEHHQELDTPLELSLSLSSSPPSLPVPSEARLNSTSLDKNLTLLLLPVVEGEKFASSATSQQQYNLGYPAARNLVFGNKSLKSSFIDGNNKLETSGSESPESLSSWLPTKQQQATLKSKANGNIRLGLRERPYCFGSEDSESVFNWLCQGFQLIKVPVDLFPSPVSL